MKQLISQDFLSRHLLLNLKKIENPTSRVLVRPWRHPEELLKVQSCQLHNNKYMIASPEITNTESFAFIVLLVFKLLSRKVVFRKKNPLKSRLLFNKIANFTDKLLQNYI